MNTWALELLGSYGLPLVILVTLASCLALPVPASLVMLAAGAFSASGDLALPSVAAGALAGAVLGDQLGFLIGRRGQSWLDRLLKAYPKRAAILAQARDLLHRRGAGAVFFSRWLVSPLGPYVNFAAGASAQGWARFTLWGILGEAVWVSLYTGLGYGFSQSFTAVAEIAANISGLLAGLALALVTGLWLYRAQRDHHRRDSG